MNTRLLLKLIWEKFHLPMLALVDADPHGKSWIFYSILYRYFCDKNVWSYYVNSAVVIINFCYPMCATRFHTSKCPAKIDFGGLTLISCKLGTKKGLKTSYLFTINWVYNVSMDLYEFHIKKCCIDFWR